MARLVASWVVAVGAVAAAFGSWPAAVAGEGVAVAPDSLVALAASAVERAVGPLPAGARLTCAPAAAPPPGVGVDAAGARIDVVLSDAAPAALMTPVCRVFSGDRLVRSVPIPMRLRVVAPALRTARRIERGEPIALDAVRAVEEEIAPPWSGVVTDLLDLEGRVARRPLAAGEILRRDLVDLPPVVRRGDRITVVVESTTVRILAAAVARADGRLGETIPVLREGGRRPLRAEVLSTDTVRLIPNIKRS